MMDVSDILITIGISGGVGVAILVYQIKLGHKVDENIDKQAKIIAEQYKREQEWRSIGGRKFLQPYFLSRPLMKYSGAW
jgi:hypothetical protein